MKKIIFAAAALLLSTGAFAQWDWGVKGGLNLAKTTDFTNPAYHLDTRKIKPSFHVGVFVEFPINDFLSIQPELIYSRQGLKSKVDWQRAWWRMNYLNLPVLAKLYVIENLSVELGPQFGYLLSAKYKTKFNGDTHTEKVKDECRDFDIAFAMGIGYKITKRLDVYGRYNLGLTKVLETGKGKNSVFQFGVGYRF